MNNDQKNKEFKLKITPEIEKGTYANAISVHINKNECILDFAFSQPNSDELIVVSRVVMSHATSEALMNTITNATLDWKNRNK